MIARLSIAAAATIIAAFLLWQIALIPIQIIGLSVVSFVVAFFAAAPLYAAHEKERFQSQQLAPQSNLSAFNVLAVFPNPAIVFDAQAIATIVNPAARSAFRGLDTGISLNQWFRDTAILAAIVDVKAKGKPVSVELVEKRPLERAFHVDLAPIDQGQTSFLVVFTEHTEALRVDRMRADFIANASHELRTPLTAVTGFLETLQGPARNDVVNRERFIALMLEQTQRMARLIDDLLSLSRFETQSHPSKVQKVDLANLAGTTIDALAGLAAAHKVKIENTLVAEAISVDGDPDELTQVLQNLIENAIKYGASGNRIEVGAARPNSREHGIFVRDFGAGIAPEHIPRLTERFYRVNIEASRQQKGTGLGLAIVKHILTRHRARIVIESRQGEGSTFSVLFPNV